MKASLLVRFTGLLLLCQPLTAQIQWYQNQDGHNPLPYGTAAASLCRFAQNSFVACYLWQINEATNTWKISRTTGSGQEIRTYFISGTNASVEIKTDANKALYVLIKKYNEQQQLQVYIQKLNLNLQVIKQRSVILENGFILTALNAFEMDNDGNVYLAGDAQQDNAGVISYASYVWKLDKNLGVKWRRSTAWQTSFARLHVDGGGRVLVVENDAAVFPAVRIRRYSNTGILLQTKLIEADSARYSISSLMDKNGNWYLFGGKLAGDTAQAIYLQKMKKQNDAVAYRKTYNSAPISQLNDLQVDETGNLYSLSTVFSLQDGDVCKIAGINAITGNFVWSRSLRFADDSCILSKLVMNDNGRFYAIGEKRGNTFFSKGFATMMNRYGREEEALVSPDSVAMQLSHWLVNGISDNDGRLIAIGNTMDFDTLTYSNTYQRAFAVRYMRGQGGCDNAAKEGVAAATDYSTAAINMEPQLSVYPNPVQQQLTVNNLNKEGYDLISVYTMQGSRLLVQTVKGDVIKLDVSMLADGVYLLVLRSSLTMKEKTIKFVVRK